MKKYHSKLQIGPIHHNWSSHHLCRAPLLAFSLVLLLNGLLFLCFCSMPTASASSSSAPNRASVEVPLSSNFIANNLRTLSSALEMGVPPPAPSPSSSSSFSPSSSSSEYNKVPRHAHSQAQLLDSLPPPTTHHIATHHIKSSIHSGVQPVEPPLNHHHRHHNSNQPKTILATDHILTNPHQVPELLDPLLRDKSNLRLAVEQTESNSHQVPTTASRMSPPERAQEPSLKSAASSASSSSSSSAPSKSIDTLDVDSFVPPGYDKLMPPKENGNPTVVRFHVWVLGLDSVDEGSMTYVADIFMSQSWKDNRLIIPHNITFNVNVSADPRGPYRLLPVTLIDKIWRPDSFFKNAKEVTFQEMTIPNHYVWLYSDHTILYMVKLSLLLSCAMKFQTYPHDTQNCTMKIESLSYTTNDLIFDWEESDPLVVEKNIELPQHDLIKKEIDYCTTTYSSGTFACVQVLFTIKRRLGYYIFHTYIPTCLIVIMSWISFWIKPEAVPARVTLCVTSLLTLSTQHAQSQKSLPPVSYIKAIDIFMSSCTVFVFASLMEYALVNILMSDELLNGWIGILAEQSNAGDFIKGRMGQQQQQQQSHQQQNHQHQHHHQHIKPPSTQNIPTIYATQAPSDGCEACCAGSTSTETHEMGDDDDRLDIDDLVVDEEDEDEEEEEETLSFTAKPKGGLNVIVQQQPNSIPAHRASFQCLTELTQSRGGAQFDPFGTNAFKLDSLNQPNKPNRVSTQPILNNRKSNSNSTTSCNRVKNTLSVNGHGGESRLRRMSHSWSFFRMLNHPSAKPVLNHRRNCQQQHHDCHLNLHHHQKDSVQVNFVNSSSQGNHLKSSLANNVHNKFVWPNHHSITPDSCNYHHKQKGHGIGGGSSGCCGGSTTGSTTGGAIPSPGSYQQQKHRRAYVVDEISRWIFPLSFIALNIVYWAYYLELIDSLPTFE